VTVLTIPTSTPLFPALFKACIAAKNRPVTEIDCARFLPSEDTVSSLHLLGSSGRQGSSCIMGHFGSFKVQQEKNSPGFMLNY
jgi:hypothetical protein